MALKLTDEQLRLAASYLEDIAITAEAKPYTRPSGYRGLSYSATQGRNANTFTYVKSKAKIIYTTLVNRAFTDIDDCLSALRTWYIGKTIGVANSLKPNYTKVRTNTGAKLLAGICKEAELY